MITVFRPKKLSGDKEMYLRYVKTKTLKSPGEEDVNNVKVTKTSLDCATIALKVLKTSVKYQKFREKHNINNRNDNDSEDTAAGGRTTQIILQQVIIYNFCCRCCCCRTNKT